MEEDQRCKGDPAGWDTDVKWALRADVSGCWTDSGSSPIEKGCPVIRQTRWAGSRWRVLGTQASSAGGLIGNLLALRGKCVAQGGRGTSAAADGGE